MRYAQLEHYIQATQVEKMTIADWVKTGQKVSS